MKVKSNWLLLLCPNPMYVLSRILRSGLGSERVLHRTKGLNSNDCYRHEKVATLCSTFPCIFKNIPNNKHDVNTHYRNYVLSGLVLQIWDLQPCTHVCSWPWTFFRESIQIPLQILNLCNSAQHLLLIYYVVNTSKFFMSFLFFNLQNSIMN